MFEDRTNQAHQTGYEIDAAHLKHKVIKEPEPEWTHAVKSKKTEDEYYGKLREVSFNTRLHKEILNLNSTVYLRI